MAVYVDDARIPYRGMLMCHMVADTSAELHAMAVRLRLPRKWAQHAGTAREHYDVCWSKRVQAIRWGAHPVTPRDLVMIIRRKRTL